MRDGQPRTHVLRFVAVAVAVSIVLGGSLIAWSWRTSSPFVMGLTLTLVTGVAAWSLIIAAVGVPVRQKLLCGLGLLAFLLAFDLIAFWTGWQNLATQSAAIEGTRESVLKAAYRVILVSSPFVTLVLFVGKKPSVFWTERES